MKDQDSDPGEAQTLAVSGLSVTVIRPSSRLVPTYLSGSPRLCESHLGRPATWRRTRHVLAVLFLAAAVFRPGEAGAASRPPGERAATAVQWQRWEAALAAEQAHPDPYAGVTVDVRFSGPDGAERTVPAFWDGERGFRFRMAFPAPGLWRWETTCNITTDAGLHGRRGEVRVSAYPGANPLFKHGDLRVSPNRRYLVHADGTPFLWLGDTGWNAAWKSTPADWREYVETRAAQRFSVLQIVTTGTGRHSTPASASGHAPFAADRTPNPAFWRELEEKIGVANDRGLFVLLTGLGKAPAGFAEQQRGPAFARWVAGRFAAHMVILSPSMDQRFEPQNDEAGVQLKALSHHLVTQHPGTHFDTAKRYHDAAYTDFDGLQTGHHSGNLGRAYAAAREWTLELWRREPIKPVINIEAMYDARGGDDGPNWREQDARKLGWLTWLSGSSGYTYGAGDVPPKVPQGGGGMWRFNTDPAAYDHWRKVLQWPSAKQMTRLRDFFATIDWWQLEPAPDLVKNQPNDPVRMMAASRGGDRLVAYLPDNQEIVLDLSGFAARIAGEWFNPVNGAKVPVIEQPTAPAAEFRRPDSWSDAVLLLHGR